MKRIITIFCLAITSAFFLLVTPSNGYVFAAEASKNVQVLNDKSDSQITLGQAQNILSTYLSKNGISYEIGTQQYIDYLLELLSKNSKDYPGLDHYDAVRAYASTYLSNIDGEEQIDNPTGLPSSEKEDSVQKIQNSNIEADKQTDNPTRNSNLVNSLTSFSYNVSAAMSYVDKYWYYRNLSYPFFYSDCTNFASQVIHAGGYAMHDGWHVKGTYGPEHYDFTGSWVNVKDFYSYWVKTRDHAHRTFKGYHSGIYTYADKGDIIQLYDQKGSNGLYHTIVVTGKSDGYLLYSGHTNSRHNNKLDDKAVNPDTNDFVVIKF